MTDGFSERVSRALQERISGKMLIDERTLSRHSTDMSIYLKRPIAVAVPEDLSDVVQLVRFCQEQSIPVTPRGGASGTAGAALGRGIVVSFPRRGPMSRIHTYDDAGVEPLVTVEPALLHDDLQRYLRERGQYLPSDPSSGAISVLGGNIATKASGPHALRHGSIDRYLKHLQFVMADGTLVDTSDEQTIPQHVKQGVAELRDEVLNDQASTNRLIARQDMKLASGYNLFTFVRHQDIGEIVAQLMVGSVGTLGIITQATLRTEPYIEGHATMLLYFRNLHEAGDAVQHIKALGVAAIEIMNHRTINIVRDRYPDVEAPDGEVHMLLVEFEGEHRYQQMEAVEEILRRHSYHLPGPAHTAHSAEEQARLWKVRKSLFPVLRNYRANLKALSVVNDVGVDPIHLADLILDLQAIFDRLELPAAMYGHAGSGNLHLRPLFDVSRSDLKSLLLQVADEVYETVLGYDGTITAEHGMGPLRVPYLEREWGATIMGYMRRIKAIFDPDDLFNPGAVFGDTSLIDDMAPL